MNTVTYVSPRYLPYIGGVETHVSEIARRTQSHYGNVSVLTTDPSGHLPSHEREDGGLTVHRVRSFAPGENYHFPSIGIMEHLYGDCRSNILHVNSIHDLPGPVAGLIGRSGSKVIVTPHYSGTFNTSVGRSVFRAYRPFLDRLFTRAESIICVSQFEVNSLAQLFPQFEDKLHVIPNGVDPVLQDKYHWERPDPPRLLYAGRLEHAKNVDKVVQAFAMLRRDWPTLRMTIHGRGPLRTELEHLTERLNLSQYVEWSPKKGVSREELYKCYASSTMLLYPSNFECYGIVPAEALSLGTPTVVTNSTALADFVRAGFAEPIEPPITIERLVQVASRILENPEKFSRGRMNGMISSWDNVAERTWKLYEPF